MKAMKRIVAGLLVLGMMLTAVGCGAEQTVVLEADMMALYGMDGTDTMTLNAKGDTVQQLTETLVINLADYDDDTKAYVISTFNELIVVPAQSISGVTCKDTSTDSSYTIELTVDCTNNNAIKDAAAAGLIQLDGNASKISLKATQSGLQSAGYKVVE